MFKLQITLITVTLAVAALSLGVTATPVPATHTPFFAKRADAAFLHARDDGTETLAQQQSRGIQAGTAKGDVPFVLSESRLTVAETLPVQRDQQGSSVVEQHEPDAAPAAAARQTDAAAEEGDLDRRIVLMQEMQDELHRQGRTSLLPAPLPGRFVMYRRKLDGPKLAADEQLLERAHLPAGSVHPLI